MEQYDLFNVETGQIRLSATSLNTYIGCPLSWFLKNIAKKKSPKRAHLIFGAVIHEMLETFYEKNFKSEDSFAATWRYEWFKRIEEIENGRPPKRKKPMKGQLDLEIDLSEVEAPQSPLIDALRIPEPAKKIVWKNAQEKFIYMKSGEQMLREFYKGFAGKPHPLHAEIRFDITWGKHLITGAIDRIDLTPDGFEIVDYKSGFKSPLDNTVEFRRNPQLTIYSYAFRKLFPGEKEVRVGIHHLRSGKVFYTERGEEDYQYLHNAMNEAASRIQQKMFSPFYGFHCGLCDYPEVCHRTHPTPGRIIISDESEDWKAWVKENGVMRKIDTGALVKKGFNSKTDNIEDILQKSD